MGGWMLNHIASELRKHAHLLERQATDFYTTDIWPQDLEEVNPLSSDAEAQESSPPSQPSLRIPWDRWRIKTDQRLEALEEQVKNIWQDIRLHSKMLEASRPPSSSGEGSFLDALGRWTTPCPYCGASLQVTLQPSPGATTGFSRSMPSTAGESGMTVLDSSLLPPTSE